MTANDDNDIVRERSNSNIVNRERSGTGTITSIAIYEDNTIVGERSVLEIPSGTITNIEIYENNENKVRERNGTVTSIAIYEDTDIQRVRSGTITSNSVYDENDNIERGRSGTITNIAIYEDNNNIERERSGTVTIIAIYEDEEDIVRSRSNSGIVNRERKATVTNIAIYEDYELNNISINEDFEINNIIEKQMLNVNSIKDKLLNADAVCFDVDSTIITEEGINVLAEYFGVENQVADLTRKAMDGNMLFEDSLGERLSLIQPSKNELTDCIEKHQFKLSNAIENVVELLHNRGVHVYLISGGFKQMIIPVAEKLNIPLHRIYSNDILFDENGKYMKFDDKALVSKDFGKAEVIKVLKTCYGYKTIVMIGDGSTDMQTKRDGVADVFIGYGGVVVRDKVKQGADWYLTDFQEIVNVYSPTQKLMVEAENARLNKIEQEKIIRAKIDLENLKFIEQANIDAEIIRLEIEQDKLKNNNNNDKKKSSNFFSTSWLWCSRN